MAIKSGAGGMNLLKRDVADEDSALAAKSKRYASAKSSGAGIGGLLGALALTVFTGGAAAPLLLAAAGGAGAFLGSQLGGATSGVNQGDLLGGKFRKKSRHNITSQIAQQEFSNVGKAALSSFMQAGALKSAGTGWASGAEAAGATGGSKLLGGLKGFGQSVLGGGAKEGLTEQTIRSAPGGSQGGMMVDGQWYGSAAPPGTKMSDLIPGGDSFINASKAGDVMGDATMTEFPGLPDNSSNPSSLLDMGAQGNVPNYTAPQSTGDVRQNAMSSLGINLPGSDDTGDWQVGEDGREWSPSLGKYKDEIQGYR